MYAHTHTYNYISQVIHAAVGPSPGRLRTWRLECVEF